MLFYFACEAAGASRARHSLRPLFGRKIHASLGRIAPRECGGVCCVSTAVIARSEATKQSIFDLASEPWIASLGARNDGHENLAPLAGRGRRRRAAKSPGEGTI